MEKMTKNRETKSLLAKLMASENINVEYRENASTAAFDTEGRTLIMPVLKDMTENATDLFLGHEVGHALYTPQGAIKDVVKKGSLFKGLVNIVEDARIEKMIQSKFPGLKKSFYNGYGDLMTSGFFDLDGKDVNEANFVDRINIHFKIGTRAGVEFSDEEMTYVNRIANQKNFDETLKISEELFDYIKDNADEEPEFDDNDDFEFGDSDEDTESNDGEMSSDMPMDSDEDDDSDSDEDSEGDTSDGSGESEEDGEEEAEENSSSTSGDDSGDAEETKETETTSEGAPSEDGSGYLPKHVKDELTSKTMESFDKALENHIDDSSTPFTYVNIPKVDIEKVLISLDDVGAELHKGVTNAVNDGYSAESIEGHIARNMKDWLKFRSENKSIVSYMAKEFEMRKSADEFKRTKVAKTGVLNPNKLHAYKFSEDLFLRSNVVSDGKNHGFVMFIDWSGSMSPNMSNTIDQLMLIAMFCKKVNIPFDVFAFTTSWGREESERGSYKFENRTKGDLVINGQFNLLHLISSTLSTAKFNTSMMHLRWMRNGMSYDSYDSNIVSSNLRLGGTPLNEAICSAFEIVPMFQKKNKVQIVNTIFLTDGQGSRLGGHWNYDNDGNWMRDSASYKSRTVITDPVTKLHYDSRGAGFDGGQAVNLLKALKDRTECRVIGFYIAPMGRSFSREVSWMTNNYEALDKMKKDLKDNAFTILDSDVGYEQFFILSDKSLKVEAGELEIDDKMTKGRMKNAFVKSRKNKIGNKAMLSKFCEFVA